MPFGYTNKSILQYVKSLPTMATMVWSLLIVSSGLINGIQCYWDFCCVNNLVINMITIGKYKNRNFCHFLFYISKHYQMIWVKITFLKNNVKHPLKIRHSEKSYKFILHCLFFGNFAPSCSFQPYKYERWSLHNHSPYMVTVISQCRSLLL